MIKSERLNRILKEIEKRGLTAYKISQHTNLTANGVQKIIDKDTENPRIGTIIEIEEFLKLDDNFSVVQEPQESYMNNQELDNLTRLVQDNWEELSKRESFKGFFFSQIAKALNMKIEDIFTLALNKK
ncbi:hypothetical protein ACJRPK_13690 [Aquimarina sp. 2-A2]|uniref:hypothetical protein n=1 Tax=Aquimarina sp. 2-A2 TaxID=3382644 RepID=UPI00387EF67C